MENAENFPGAKEIMAKKLQEFLADDSAKIYSAKFQRSSFFIICLSKVFYILLENVPHFPENYGC